MRSHQRALRGTGFFGDFEDCDVVIGQRHISEHTYSVIYTEVLRIHVEYTHGGGRTAKG